MGIEGESEGSDLLKTVSEKYPEIMRNILTGYPEYDVSLSDQNGKVFDFIVKTETIKK